MKIFSFFIEHPRFSIVISCVFVLLGVLALFVLPVSQYPQITPPQIIVSAVYPGANSKVVQDTVAIVIENQLNGIDGMLYMSSTCTDNGEYKLTMTFDIGVDADIAQVKVENKLQQITASLPEIVSKEGLTITSETANILGMLVLYSPDQTYDALSLSQYAYTRLLNPLERIRGIASATVYGAKTSVRIWMNPIKLASLELNASDVINAIQSQNTQAALGTIGGSPADQSWKVVFNISSQGLLTTVQDFENIVVATDKSGGIVRLKDVARIEIGADSYTVQSTYNNQPAVIIGLSQTPDSNSLQVMKQVKELIHQMKQSFGSDLAFEVAYDSTQFVKASLDGIVMTLIITFCLVVVIVFMFLQNLKATFIPMITIPVSLIATFSVIYVLGFNINILTLFAMILAIGLVVDDAIIVVERVQYLMKYKRMNARQASVQAMQDISGAIIATTLVLLSIFIPVGLMAGITGKIYQQFAVTISTAVIFSAINALTLSPALCAFFLMKTTSESPKFYYFNQTVNWFQSKYKQIVRFFIMHLRYVMMIFGGVLVMIGWMFFVTPTSFIPQEDEGVIFANIQLKNTDNLNQTNNTLSDLGKMVLTTDGVQFFIGISGASLLGGGGENIGMGVIGLKNWDERKSSQLSLNSLMNTLQTRINQDLNGSINLFALPAIPGVGNSNGLSFQLNALNPDITFQKMSDTLNTFLGDLNRHPDIQMAFSVFGGMTPHIFVDLDRTKTETLGVPVSDLFSVLQNNFGSRYVNDVTLDDQVNKVIIQSDFSYRKTQQDIENTYLKTSTNKMVQVKNFADLSIQMMPQVIYRFNTYLSAGITAQVSKHVSTGQAIQSIREMVRTLGNNYGVSWTGLTLQEVETKGLVVVLIGLACIFSYLFLVALYESWLIALSVLFSTVFGVLGALIGLHIMDLPLSIYAQLGLILLIGLSAKNAILIVEFILTYQRQGMNLLQSAVQGSAERFRAVIMTALTFILGVMPMVFDTGAGSASQNAMGTSVFFGMIFATSIGVLFIPALFAVCAHLIQKYYHVYHRRIK